MNDKKIHPSSHIGDGGIALIHLRTQQMGYVWHDRTTDAGIDGSIEVRNPATDVVANRHLFVQSKASSGRFPGETEDSFHYICEQRDIDYWLQAEVPVLLICSHPETEEAWWKDVTTTFADPVRRATGRVDFTKSTDRFDRTAAGRLLTLADPHATAHTPTADRRAEQIESNLLPAIIPTMVFSSPTSLSKPEGVYQAIRKAGTPLRQDWTLRDGRLNTFLDPAETGLSVLTSGPPDVVATTAWADSGDKERSLVALLNRALVQDVSAECDYHRGRDLVYFRASEDLTNVSIRGENGRSRLVFHAKQNKNTGNVWYYKHAALAWRFLRVDTSWYCALVPDYHFTHDGRRDSRFMSELLAGIKRLERNLAVLGATRMWSSYLRGTSKPPRSDRDAVIDFGAPLIFATDTGIDDAAWAADLRAQPDPAPERITPHDLRGAG